MAEAEAQPRFMRRMAEPVLLGAAVLLFVVLTHYHQGQVCDDAFIAFRYANHVGSGLGPVWNRGQAVEGFSSPLWVGLLALGKLVGADLGTWASALGVLFSALCLILVQRLSLALSGARVLAALACLVAALIYPLYFWAPAGLETALVAALVTAGTWSLAMQSSWSWALVAAFLGVARPEGLFLALGLVGLARLAHGRAATRIAKISIALGPAVACLAFRLYFYGEWLPNTYYAKATGGFLFRMQAGIIYALWAVLALAATGAALWIARIAERRILAAMAFLVLVLVPVVAAGGDWMWHERMLLPVLPALTALAVTAVFRAHSHRRPVLALALALAGSPFLPSASRFTDALAWKCLPASEYQEGTMTVAASEVARFIAAHYPADALVAVNHAGALPYRLPNPVLDMTGLCDHHIAHQVEGAVHQKYDPAYVLEQKPRLVVLNTRVRPGEAGTWYHPGYWIGETALVERPEFQKLYRPVRPTWEWQWIRGTRSFILLYERVEPTPEPAGN